MNYEFLSLSSSLKCSTCLILVVFLITSGCVVVRELKLYFMFSEVQTRVVKGNFVFF